MKKCKIRYFGMIAEKLGKDSEEVFLDDLMAKSEKVNLSIIQQNPELEGMTFTVAINDKLSNNWEGHDEIRSIAVLPPFAGG